MFQYNKKLSRYIEKVERMISKYQDFLLENEFSTIMREFYQLLESEGRQTGPYTYEWDFRQEDPEKKDFLDKIVDKLESFLRKIPTDKIKHYFNKFIESVVNLPASFRRKLLVAASVAFLAFSSLTTLMSSSADDTSSSPKTEEVKKEFKKLVQKSSFEKSQKLVSFSEAGYSDDRSDTGNWIDVPGGRRFVGTKYGISAPVLRDYWGRLPKAEDMINLKYSVALEIYKSDYWKPQHLEDFSDQNIANVLYDGCVNQGVEGTKQVLRESLRELGVKITDAENPFTKKRIREANSLDPVELFDTIKANRESRYREASTFNVHGDGWLARLDDIKYQET
jgi:lysozyme family protein